MKEKKLLWLGDGGCSVFSFPPQPAPTQHEYGPAPSTPSRCRNNPGKARLQKRLRRSTTRTRHSRRTFSVLAYSKTRCLATRSKAGLRGLPQKHTSYLCVPGSLPISQCRIFPLRLHTAFFSLSVPLSCLRC